MSLLRLYEETPFLLGFVECTSICLKGKLALFMCVRCALRRAFTRQQLFHDVSFPTQLEKHLFPLFAHTHEHTCEQNRAEAAEMSAPVSATSIPAL